MAVIQPITNVGGIDSGAFGFDTAVINTANGVFANGFDTANVGNALITPYALNVDLPFRQPETTHFNKNRLSFGETQTQAIASCGGIDGGSFGFDTYLANTAQTLSLNGVDYGVVGVLSITPYRLNADLSFDLINHHDINKNRLDFDAKVALVISNVGDIGGFLGQPEIYQQSGLRPLSIAGCMGHTLVFNGNQNGGGVDLHFRLPERQDLNKYRLDFGNTSQLAISNTGGIDSLDFGSETHIENTAKTMRTHGVDSAFMGNAFIFSPTTPLFEEQKNAASVDLLFDEWNWQRTAQNIPLPFNSERRIKDFAGIDGSEFGFDTKIYNKKQIVTVDSALLHDEIGYHKLRYPFAPNVLVLPSIGDTAYITPNHQVISYRQQITIGGIDAYQNAINDAINSHDLHGHSIANRNQYITAGGDDYSLLGNSHWISNFERTIEVQTGINTATFGQAWVDYGKREINLNNQGIEPTPLYANAHSIGTSQTIAPKGWESTEWLTRIIPERQSLNVIGWNSQEKGQIEQQEEHKIFNETQRITIKGDYSPELTTLYGSPYLYNLTQYINADFLNNGIAPIDASDTHYKEKWHSIANANRVVGVFGIDSERHGKQHYLKNTAKRINGIGFVGSDFGNAFIAHAVRYVETASIPPLAMSRWHSVYNAASGIYPVGFDLDMGAKPWIENTRRYYRWVGLGEQTEWGTPFIDFAVRKIHPYRIAPDYLDKPTVFNSDSYIQPDSIVSVFGDTEVKETRNIIQVETLQSGEKSVGQPEKIYNFNKEIHHTGGFDSSEFGFTTKIDNWKKYIEPQGVDWAVVEKPVYVGDNTQRIYSGGLLGEQQSYLHKVIMGIAPPYATQQIILNEIKDGNGKIFTPSCGIAPPNGQVGCPEFTDNTLYHKQQDSFTRFGQPEIYSNSIKIESGIYNPFDFGTPFIVYPQTISVVNNGIDPPVNQVPKIRLSPNTIYAPSSDMATLQARHNHPTNHQPNLIGYPNDTVIDGYKFGVPEIQNQHRTIYHREPQNGYGNNMLRFGEHKISNTKNIIAVKGFQPMRFGLPELPCDQEIELPRRNAKEYTEFGVATIGMPKETKQYIKPKGISEVWGKNEIQNFNREVYLVGFDSLQMGRSDNKDKLYMPQSLWIGFPIPTIIDGNEFSEWGNAWISNYIQEIKPLGSDMLQMRYDRTKFKDRMTVKRISPNPPPKN